jgi:hypothetical protein
MQAFTMVMLVVTIITGEGKQNIQHREPMPDMQTCFQEAAEFMQHRFPDEVDAKGLAASCQGKLAEEKPS